MGPAENVNSPAEGEGVVRGLRGSRKSGGFCAKGRGFIVGEQGQFE